MSGRGSAGIDKLPEELVNKIRTLRASGLGAERICQALPEIREVYGVGHESIKNYIYSRSGVGTHRAAPTQNVEKLGKIAELLEKSGINPEDIGKVQTVTLSNWQGLTKNAEGEAEVHELEGARIVLSPAWADGPTWQPVDRGPAVKLPKPPPLTKVADGWERAFLWPDTQVGYRRSLSTMALEPFHDETAIACALAVMREVKPHKVVIFGDFLDLPEFGTFEQEPGFALTVQPAIDAATYLLGEIRAAAGAAEIVFIEGNHDRRLQKAITRNAMAAFGLKRGNSPPAEWPVLSIPYLLRMDEFDVAYIGGYPAGLYWINSNCAAVHGSRINSAGSTALRVIDDSRVSVVFGHVHRIELMHRTRQSFEGAKRNFAASVGCLCRIDGAVPSFKSSTDVFGNSVPTVEQWQHGCAVLLYEPGDGRFHLDLIAIQDGTAMLWGKEVSV